MRYLEARNGCLSSVILPGDIAAACGQRAVRYRMAFVSTVRCGSSKERAFDEQNHGDGEHPQ